MSCIFQVGGSLSWYVSGESTWVISKGPRCFRASLQKG